MSIPPPPDEPPQRPEMLTAAEVATLLRVSKKTNYEAVQRGEVPGAIRVGRVLRFARDVVLQWIRQGRSVSTRKKRR